MSNDHTPEEWEENYNLGIEVGKVAGREEGYTEGLLTGRQTGWVSGYEDSVAMFKHDFKNYVEIDVDYLLENSRPCD